MREKRIPHCLISNNPKHKKAVKIISKRIKKIAQEYQEENKLSTWFDDVFYAIQLKRVWKNYEYLI